MSKSTEPLICYCFGYTKTDIITEIEAAGHSVIMEKIKQNRKAGTCECDTKHPESRCCIGDVHQVVKEYLYLKSTHREQKP